MNTDISDRMLVPYVAQTDAVAADFYAVDLEQGQALTSPKAASAA